MQGVPFREEDKTALQDAQSELRRRVAEFVREHKDHYVRRTFTTGRMQSKHSYSWRTQQGHDLLRRL